jgi:hypothetical protein
MRRWQESLNALPTVDKGDTLIAMKKEKQMSKSSEYYQTIYKHMKHQEDSV